jgi:Family of unknown function (DUF6157)
VLKVSEIIDTFVQVSPDCPVHLGVMPTNKNDAKPSMHVLQYQLLIQNPYRFTLEDLIYEVHIRHKQIPLEQAEAHAETIRRELFEKKHPCMRASMLPKKYGWGVHYDQEGRLALYGMETEEYRRFVQNSGTGDGPKLVFAMRSSRA